MIERAAARTWPGSKQQPTLVADRQRLSSHPSVARARGPQRGVQAPPPSRPWPTTSSCQERRQDVRWPGKTLDDADRIRQAASSSASGSDGTAHSAEHPIRPATRPPRALRSSRPAEGEGSDRPLALDSSRPTVGTHRCHQQDHWPAGARCQRAARQTPADRGEVHKAEFLGR